LEDWLEAADSSAKTWAGRKTCQSLLPEEEPPEGLLEGVVLDEDPELSDVVADGVADGLADGVAFF